MAPSAMKTNADPCPDLETLAAYIDGRLSEGERALVAEHLAGCETCYFVFTESTQLRASGITPAPVDALSLGEDTVAIHRRWLTPKIVWSSAAGLAAAASVILAVATGMLPWSGESTELRALVVAVGTDRMIEPRVTGGFAYGPVRAPVRGEPGAATVSPDVRIAAARIEKDASAHRSAQTLHSLGIAYLVTGNSSRAVVVLDEAAAESSDARIFSDLAAAYIARGAGDNNRQDFMAALSAVDRALGADPRLPEAWFNRGEVLERLGLTAQARDAWQQYLKIDSESAWASEARLHLSASGGR